MDKSEKKQINRIMNWRKHNSGLWKVLCNSYEGEKVSFEAYQNTLSMIQKESLHEMLFVFIESHKRKPLFQGIFHDMFIDMVNEKIKKGEEKVFIEKLIRELD